MVYEPSPVVLGPEGQPVEWRGFRGRIDLNDSLVDKPPFTIHSQAPTDRKPIT